MIAVVIVAFDKHARLRQHLELLRGQGEKPDCVIISNCGRESVEWARDEFGPSFKIEILSFGNIGPAGGFREGAKKAYGLGYDYVIFADDDAHPRPGALARFFSHAKSGAPAVAGYYAMGDRVTTSNHYLMVGRDVLARAGFHFAPLFIMMEDSEFYDRIGLAAPIIHDEGIVIGHPGRPVQSFERWRLTSRNFMICSSLRGYRVFLRNSITMPMRIASLSALSMKGGFLRAYAQGFLDFTFGRHGRPENPVGGAFEPKILPKLDENDVDAAVVRTDGEKARFGEKGTDEGALRNGLGPARMMDCALRWAGKKVYMSSTFFFADMSAYLPCALLAGEIYTDDSGKPAFAFKGGLPKAAAFIAAFALLAAPAVLLSLPLYFLRGMAYRNMFARQMRDDSEFCADADKRLMPRPKKALTG